MKKVAIGLGIGCGGLMVLSIAGTIAYLTYVGIVGPETSIYTGNRVPSRFVETIESLELLDEGEQIRWFYSDGMTDITNGLYFVTDKHLVLYSKNWTPEKNIIPFASITDVNADYDDSFFLDTTVFVTTRDGTEYSFPLSSEKGLDKKVVAFLESQLTADQSQSDKPE